MAIAQVQVPSSGSNSFGTSLGTAYGSNNTAGNLLVMGATSTEAITSVTDSNTGTPASAVAITHPSEAASTAIWYVMNCPSGANTVTSNTVGSAPHTNHLLEYSGVATASALDQTATNSAVFNTSGNTGTTGTTAQADELLIGLIGNEGVRTHTWGSSFTEKTDVANANSGSIAERIVSATGTYAGTATISSNSNWCACIATFKAAAGGGGTSILRQMMQHGLYASRFFRLTMPVIRPAWYLPGHARLSHVIEQYTGRGWRRLAWDEFTAEQWCDAPYALQWSGPLQGPAIFRARMLVLDRGTVAMLRPHTYSAPNREWRLAS